MAIRILISGILAGLAVFFTGAFTHSALNWGGRAIKPLPNEEAFVKSFVEQKAEPGMYAFPFVANDAPPKEQERVNEVYKKGPAGLVIVAPTGQDQMPPEVLAKELATNILGAILAAWIVSQFAPGKGFAIRFVAVFAMGMFAWLAIDASYLIWYRFSQNFVTDALFSGLLENTVAGLIIAAIIRPNGKIEQ
jgi:hypothetical protein